MSVVDALVAVGLADSRNAARRAIGEGGASVNGCEGHRCRAHHRRMTCSTTASSCSAVVESPCGGASRLTRGQRSRQRRHARVRADLRGLRGVGLQFSTSAREGATDAKRWDAHPGTVGAGPAEQTPDQVAVRSTLSASDSGLELGPERCYSVGPAEIQARLSPAGSREQADLTPKQGRG